MKELGIFIGIVSIVVLIVINIFFANQLFDIEISKENIIRLLWYGMALSLIQISVALFIHLIPYVIIPIIALILIGILIYKIFFQKKL